MALISFLICHAMMQTLVVVLSLLLIVILLVIFRRKLNCCRGKTNHNENNVSVAQVQQPDAVIIVSADTEYLDLTNLDPEHFYMELISNREPKNEYQSFELTTDHVWHVSFWIYWPFWWLIYWFINVYLQTVDTKSTYKKSVQHNYVNYWYNFSFESTNPLSIIIRLRL